MVSCLLLRMRSGGNGTDRTCLGPVRNPVRICRIGGFVYLCRRNHRIRHRRGANRRAARRAASDNKRQDEKAIVCRMVVHPRPADNSPPDRDDGGVFRRRGGIHQPALRPGRNPGRDGRFGRREFHGGGPDRTVHRQRRDGKLPLTDPHLGRVAPAAEAQRIRDGRSDPRGALPRSGQCGGESPRPGACAVRRADRRKCGRDRSALRPHDPRSGQLPHDADLPARAAPPARSARRRVRRSGAPHPEPAARPHRPADG